MVSYLRVNFSALFTLDKDSRERMTTLVEGGPALRNVANLPLPIFETLWMVRQERAVKLGSTTAGMKSSRIHE